MTPAEFDTLRAGDNVTWFRPQPRGVHWVGSRTPVCFPAHVMAAVVSNGRVRIVSLIVRGWVEKERIVRVGRRGCANVRLVPERIQDPPP